MSIPVEGRVTLQNNRAVVVLNVAASSQAEERPASSTPRQSLAAMVCNVQKGLKLEPVRLHGAWNAAAEEKLLECLTKPKRVVTPKQHVSSLPAPAPAVTFMCISRKRFVFLATPLPGKAAPHA